MSIHKTLDYKIEGTADWRRQKAEQFPDDSRNLEAAEELDRLVKEVSQLEGSELHRRMDRLDERLVDTPGFEDIWGELSEEVSAALRDVGFRGGYSSGVAFLEWYCERLEEAIQKLIDKVNDDDDDIPSPSLSVQVENDDAVKAAKQAYDEARAKAYAEARKRL